MLDFELIAESTLDLELWFDLKGQQHWVNSLVANTLGIDKATLLSQPDFPLQIVSPLYRPRFQKLLQQVAAEHLITDLEIQLQHRNGKTLAAALSAKLVSYPPAQQGIRMSIRLLTDPNRLDNSIRYVLHHSANAGLTNPLFNLCQALAAAMQCSHLYLFEKQTGQYQPLFQTAAVDLPLPPADIDLLHKAEEQGLYVISDPTRLVGKAYFHHFPKGLISIALHDSEQQVNAVLVGLFATEMNNPLLLQALFQFFSPQLAAELRRYYAEQYIQQLNNQLELMIAERTRELEQTLEHLKLTQQQLLHSEKMASLTILIAGMAHKLNTPISNVLISSDHLKDEVSEIKLLSEQTQLSRKRFELFIQHCLDASKIIFSNISRASQLVESFKNLATVTSNEQAQAVKLSDILTHCQALLAIEFDTLPPINWCTEQANVVIRTHPQLLTQVILQILTNAIRHAFAGVSQPEIHISVDNSKTERLTIRIKDNGKGIAAKDLPKIFDPFFGQNLNSGTAGLGLYLCYNLVAGPLAGTIEARSAPDKGAEFIISLPREP